MKLIEKDKRGEGRSFEMVERTIPCLDDSWHFHSRYELILITSSSGIRFVGDNVSEFLPGDLVLVGPNLPHLWRNNPSYYKDESDKDVRTIIIKFSKEFLGEHFFDVEAFSSINALLKDACHGVSFGTETANAVSEKMIALTQTSGASTFIGFLDILDQLSLSEGKQYLSSSDMSQMNIDKENNLNKVIKYISDNYATNISLEDISSVACMTTNSFCRYFKRMTNKSFSHFLNEVRISNATRLLVQNDELISDVAYLVGYKSVNNFNKQFKRIVGKTPKAFRKDF
jgi:AraC-like DNA-binding protein